MKRSGWNPWLGQVALAGSRRARLGDVTGLNDDTFSQATNAPASVVDFWSPSCLPCMRYKPVFEAVAAQPPGGVFMATVNADESPQTMAYYGIDSIPTTLFFVNGEEVNRTQGSLQRQELLDTISNYIPSAAPTASQEVVAPAQGPTYTPAGAAQTVTPSQPAQVVKPGPVKQPPPAGASAQTPPKSAPAASSPGLSKTTLLVGGVAVVAVTAMIILFSGD